MTTLPELQTDAAARTYRLRMNVIAMVAANIIHGAVIVSVWPNMRAVALVASLMVMLGLVNTVIGANMVRLGVVRSDWLRVAPNLLGCIVIGVATDWPLPLWLFLPFFAYFHDGYRESQSTLRFALYIGGWTLAAIASGASPRRLLAFSFLAVLAALATTVRQRLVAKILRDRAKTIEELSRANEELGRIKQELEAAHRVAVVNEKLAGIGMLAAGVAHEINNPMSYVTANLRTMLEDLRMEENLSPLMREYRDEILPETLSGVQRVNTIVADLRRFARGEVEERSTFDINAELQAAVRIAALQLKPSQKLHVDLQPLPALHGNARQIGQVALNLIVNAIQSLSQTGIVSLTSEATTDGVAFRVSDNGCGMSEESRAKLFQPFFTTKSPGVGTGLGLSVAHGIIQSHGGRIEVESAIGRGSTFTVSLPVETELVQLAA